MTAPSSPIRAVSSSAANSPPRKHKIKFDPEEIISQSSSSETKKRKIDPARVDVLPPERAKVYPDRFIPPRSLLSLPPAQAILDPLPSRNIADLLHQRALAIACFGHPQRPDELPILRKTKPKQIDCTPPSFAPHEKYTHSSARILDLPGFADDFYSHSISMASVTDQLAIVLHGLNYTNAAGTADIGTQIYLFSPDSNAIDTVYPANALCSSAKRPNCVALSPKGKLLIAGKFDGTLEFWKTPNTLLGSLKPDGISSIRAIAIVGSVAYVGDHSGKLFEIDLKARKVIRSRQDHSAILCSIAISPKGKYLATGGNDNQVVVYNAQTMEVVTKFGMQAAVRAISFDPTNDCRIAIGGGSADPRICIYDFSDLKHPKHIEIRTDSQITNLIWRKQNRIFSTHRDGSYRVIPIEMGRPVPVGKIRAFSIPNCGRILFAGLRSKEETLVLGSPDRLDFIPLPKPPAKKYVPSLLESTNTIR